MILSGNYRHGLVPASEMSPPFPAQAPLLNIKFASAAKNRSFREHFQISGVYLSDEQRSHEME